MQSFKIYSIWPQASKQADIHTTSANAVTLVWRSLRLAPITLEIIMSSRFAVFLAKYMLQSDSQLEEQHLKNRQEHIRTGD